MDNRFLHWFFPGLKDFDPNQTRDESGKWSETGAGGSSSGKKKIFYRGETGGGALFGGETRSEDLPGIYITENPKTAMDFSTVYASNPTGKIAKYTLDDTAKVAQESDLEKRGVYSDNPYSLVGDTKKYYEWQANRLRKLGYHVLHRTSRGIDETIVLDETKLIPVKDD